MTDPEVEELRRRCKGSAERLPFADGKDVFEYFRSINKTGSLQDCLFNEIRAAIINATPTGIVAADVR